MIVLAVIGSVFARVFYFKSTRLIGATKASLIDAAEPFASAFMAFIFLKQSLTLPIAVGAALMMASVALLLKEKTPGE